MIKNYKFYLIRASTFLASYEHITWMRISMNEAFLESHCHEGLSDDFSNAFQIDSLVSHFTNFCDRNAFLKRHGEDPFISQLLVDFWHLDPVMSLKHFLAANSIFDL